MLNRYWEVGIHCSILEWEQGRREEEGKNGKRNVLQKNEKMKNKDSAFLNEGRTKRLKGREDNEKS